MGKKGSRRKKSKPLKSPVKKIEARLRGYWNNEAWEEFITLFQRQQSKAEKSAVAHLWDPAVYNLMVRTAFMDRDILKIDRLCREMRKSVDISEDNQKCLHVLEVLLDVHKGNAWPGLAETLPADLPGPFAGLSSGLKDLLWDKSLSPLSRYADGRQKNAKKGEKHYARAAAIARGFNSLRQEGFNPSSIRPLTKLKKDIEEAQKFLSDNTGVSSHVLAGMSILVELMHKLYAKRNYTVDNNSILDFLKVRNFHASNHPAVQCMAQAFFVLGKNLSGPAWEYETRKVLHEYFPMSVDIPGHVQNQLKVLDAVTHEHDLALPVTIEYALENNVWTARERVILSLAGLSGTAIRLESIFYQISQDIMTGNEEEAYDIIDSVLTRSCEFLKNIIEYSSVLNLDDPIITTEAAEQWHAIVSVLPVEEHTEILDSLINKVYGSSAPDSVLLGMIHKRVEVRSDISKIYSLSRIIKKRAPLKVSPEDLEHAAGHVHSFAFCRNIFDAWKQCLSAADYEFLVQKFIYRLYDDAFKADDMLPFFSESVSHWVNMPDELIWDFADTLGKDFPLYGLMLLTATVAGDYPMPRNAGEAKPFFDHLPPDDILFDVLLEMLSWPSTPYRNAFLGKIIEQLTDYMTQVDRWSELVIILTGKKLKILSHKVWDIWERKNLFKLLRDSNDFNYSVDILKPFVKKPQLKPRNKKKKATRSVMKQKRLLDAMLDQQEQSSGKGN